MFCLLFLCVPGTLSANAEAGGHSAGAAIVGYSAGAASVGYSAGAMPVGFSADAATVTLNSPGDKYVGDEVALSGTSSLTEVSIKVVRPDGTILFFDLATVSGGAFGKQLKLPADAQPGTYTVVAGNGTDVATATFVVSARTGSGGISYPGTPESPVSAGPNGIRLADNAIRIANETDADGHSIAVATVDAAALGKAFDALSAANQTGSGAGSDIIVEIAGNHSSLKVELPAGAIIDAARTSPSTVIVVQSGKTSYRLPVSLAALQSAFKALGAKPGDTASGDANGAVSNDAVDAIPVNAIIAIRFEEVSGQLLEQLKKSAEENNAVLLSPIVDFTLTVELDGKSQQITDFGHTYVSRTLTIDGARGTIDPSRATAVMFDRATGAFSFVPSVFESADGVTTVTIKRNGNSVYGVIEAAKSFDDLSKHWAKTDIEKLAAKQIVKGRTDTRFAPEATISRAEFTALLVRALGLSAAKSTAVFSDVPTNAWYAEAASMAVEAQLVTGTGGGKFQPDAPVTREQIATLIARALDMTGRASGDGAPTASGSTMTDAAQISSWASGAVTRLMNAHIVKGFPDGTFRPQQHASRAEATVILKRMLEYVEFINK